MGSEELLPRELQGQFCLCVCEGVGEWSVKSCYPGNSKARCVCVCVCACVSA